MKNGKAADKQRMQMDAYAMANLECEYKLAQKKYEENKNDQKLKSEFDKLKKDIDTFSRKINSRYRSIKDLNKKFNSLIESARSELTTCGELKAFEEANAQKEPEKE